MQEMRHRTDGGAMIRMAVLLTVTALVGLVGFLAAGSIARSATQTNSTVSVHRTKLGLILVQSRGRTLYLFLKDRDGKSACAGSCAGSWPPLVTRGKPTAGSGVNPSLLGTTRRSNGSVQLTFVLDKQAGQTKGEGNFAFGARWYAVSGRGTAVVKAPPTTTTTATTNSCLYPPCP